MEIYLRENANAQAKNVTWPQDSVLSILTLYDTNGCYNSFDYDSITQFTKMDRTCVN